MAHPPDPARDPRVASLLRAARAAAASIAAVGDPARLAGGSVVEKGAAGPATVADLAAQAAITVTLRSALGPATRIVAEESLEEAERLGGPALVAGAHAAVAAGGIEVDERSFRAALASGGDAGGAGSFWTVDPLDGTKGYLRGGQFAVAIALVEDGRPVLGALIAPRLGHRGSGAGGGVVALAAAGGGAFQSSLGSWEPSRLLARPWAPGAPIRVAGSIEKAHSASDSLEARITALGPVDPVRIDSQAKYLLVARGDADCYARLSPTAGYRECIWDHAAGALVAEEAGARASDALGRQLDFSAGRRFRDSAGIVCAAPGLHEAVVAAIRSSSRPD
jgi:HAL2 family 3'(2'),5'-bisphosphate nucleotidase